MSLADRIRSVLNEHGGEVRFTQLYRELGHEFLSTEIRAELDHMNDVALTYTGPVRRGPSTLVIRRKGRGQTVSEAKLSRTELKEKAREAIMEAVALTWHHWRTVENDIPDSQHEEFDAVIKREADRVARLMGYEESWKA